jgi:hypothetical protein
MLLLALFLALTPAQALDQLKEGNTRFAENQPLTPTAPPNGVSNSVRAKPHLPPSSDVQTPGLHRSSSSTKVSETCSLYELLATWSAPSRLTALNTLPVC